VICSPPSGGAFPIGDITVTCSASDDAGNSSTRGFVVHVKGATEQIADLSGLIDSYNLPLSR
jgi:hypothetical protein